MDICVIGTGYVGLVTGACLADVNENRVICVDIDKNKINKLKKGVVPFYEPGLDVIVKNNLDSGKLKFTTDIASAVKKSKVVFVAVGTPPNSDGSVDVSQIYTATSDIAKNLNSYKVIINKSTVPIGTAKEMTNIISQSCEEEFDVVSNPEFLREGSAVKDFYQPERIVVGLQTQKARQIIVKLYENFDCPKLFTNWETAEIIKYASNAFLATKISFVNEVANLCESVGADIENVALAMGYDSRIGKSFLKAGVGYGGSCFPKDVKALHSISSNNNYDFKLLKSVIEVNNQQRLNFYNKIKKTLKEINNKKIGIWGLTFKPDTDDMRESPSIDIINYFLSDGAKIKVYDPVGMKNAKKIFKNDVEYCKDEYECAENVDALVILTEWKIFKDVDLKKLIKVLKNPIIFDGRNIYDLETMLSSGFKYISIGR